MGIHVKALKERTQAYWEQIYEEKIWNKENKIRIECKELQN